MAIDQTVAIITRTKDRPLFLARCIELILSQDFQNWTHIIVNDGGDPANVVATTSRYTDHYKSRLVVVHHESNLGMEAASNTGLRACRTTLVTFLDDDDTWDKQFLSEMVSTLHHANDDQIKGVVCQTEIVQERMDGKTIVELAHWPFNPQLKLIALAELMVANRFTNNAFLFRRDAIDEASYFDEGLPVLGDWDFNVRFALSYEIVVLDKMLARWHIRYESASDPANNSTNTSMDLHGLWRARLMNDLIRGRRLGKNKNLSAIAVLGAKLNVIEEKIDSVKAQSEHLQQILQVDMEEVRRTVREFSFFWQIRRGVAKLFRSLFARDKRNDC